MKISRIGSDRNINKEDVNIIVVEIGSKKYTLSESIDNRLNVNKYDDSDKTDSISVHPRSGNVVELD